MAMPIFMLQGKVSSTHALVVSATGTGTTTTPTGGAMPIAMVQGKVTSGNALVVVMV